MGNSCGLLMDEDAREQREMKQYYQTRRSRALLPQYGPEAIYGPSHAYTVATALPDMSQSKSRSRSRGASGSMQHIEGLYSPVVRTRAPSDASRMGRAHVDGRSRPSGTSTPQGYGRAYTNCAPLHGDRLDSSHTIPVARPGQPSDTRSQARHPSDTRSRTKHPSDSRSRTRYPAVPTEAPPHLTREYILNADFVSAGGETPEGAAERRARYRAQQQALSNLGNNLISALD